MDIGRLDRQIFLQRMTRNRSAVSQEEVEAVAETVKVWAGVRMVSSDELRVVTGEVMVGVAEFTIRYFKRFDGRTWRIKTEDGKIWDAVDLPREIGRREGMVIRARWTGRTEAENFAELM